MTDHQLKIQEAILLKIHKGCSIEECYKKEIVKGCLYSETRDKTDKTFLSEVLYDGHIPQSNKDLKGYILKIIGLPPTLPRVLYAIGVDYDYSGELGCITHKVDGWEDKQKLCERRLLNNGTDATLFEQSELTQKKIGELLGVTL